VDIRTVLAAIHFFLPHTHTGKQFVFVPAQLLDLVVFIAQIKVSVKHPSS